MQALMTRPLHFTSDGRDGRTGGWMDGLTSLHHNHHHFHHYHYYSTIIVITIALWNVVWGIKQLRTSSSNDSRCPNNHQPTDSFRTMARQQWGRLYHPRGGASVRWVEPRDEVQFDWNVKNITSHWDRSGVTRLSHDDYGGDGLEKRQYYVNDVCTSFNLFLRRDYQSLQKAFLLSIHPPIHPPVHPSIHQSIHPSIRPSIHSPIHPSTIHIGLDT